MGKRNFTPKGATDPRDSGFEASTPENRVQGDQNAPTASEGAKIEVDNAPPIAKKTTRGSRLKQEIAASVITDPKAGALGGTGSSSAIAYSNLKTMAYSGDAGTILGSAASTPIVGKPDRADSRFGKKLDVTAKKINYLAAERVSSDFEGPKTLSEAGGVQGYNGTPQNDSVRLQKNSGATNAELMYDRSVDEISRDEFFFTMGQVVKQQGVDYQDSPTKSVDDSGTESAYDCPRGNYINKQIDVTFSISPKDGSVYVKSFKPVTVKLNDTEPINVINHAGSNHIIDMNVAEANRMTMDAKAGDETKPNWTPLVRAIQQPSQTIGFLRDMECDVGSYLLASMRFAGKSLSYQINKAAKDGIREVSPMREMFLRHLTGSSNSMDYESYYSDIFDVNSLQQGSAAFMIAFRDSITKYKTKADILTMPLSLKSHYEVAQSHHKAFKCKPEFAAALDARDVFSTIDRDYDPLMPICITDGIQLISPISWENMYSYDVTYNSKDKVFTRTFVNKPFGYSYVINHTTYTTTVEHPILKALDEFCNEHSNRIYRILTGVREIKADGADVTWHIPVRSTTRSFSLWDFLLCSLTPKMEKIRSNSMWDVLNYERAYEYPFTQLSSIGPMFEAERTNYKFTDAGDRLQTKQMKTSTAITWKMPEVFWNPGKDKDQVNEDLTVHPFYFSQGRYRFTADNSAILKDDAGSMLFPVSRAGIVLDSIASMIEQGERSVRLSYDMMVRSPFEDGLSPIKASVYKYSQNADGILSVITNTHPDLIAYLSTPRELGWSFVAPLGIITNYKVSTKDSDDYRPYNYAMYDSTFKPELTPSYRVTTYRSFSSKPVPTDTLSVATVNVNRGEDYKQCWSEVASYDVLASNALQPVVTGLEFSPSAVFSRTKANEQLLFSAFTTGMTDATNRSAEKVSTTAPKIKQINRGFWTTIQKMPFIISPFDTALKGVAYDPFDIAYLFNFAGFLESDYNEDIYNRMLERQTYEYSYSSDPFLTDSYLYK